MSKYARTPVDRNVRYCTSDCVKDHEHMVRGRDGRLTRHGVRTMSRVGGTVRVIKVGDRCAVSVPLNAGYTAGMMVYLTIDDGEGNSHRVLRDLKVHDDLLLAYVTDLGYHAGDIVDYTVGRHDESVSYEYEGE